MKGSQEDLSSLAIYPKGYKEDLSNVDLNNLTGGNHATSWAAGGGDKAEDKKKLGISETCPQAEQG